MRFALAVLALACWEGRSLLATWRESPLERAGALIFLLWLLPLLVARPTLPKPNVSLAALALVALGTLTDLNGVRLLALAVAVSGWAGRAQVVFLATALSWMPLTSWLGGSVLLRFVVALLPWAIFWRTWNASVFLANRAGSSGGRAARPGGIDLRG